MSGRDAVSNCNKGRQAPIFCAMVLTSLSFALFLLTGCAGTPPAMPDDVLSLTGRNASLYAVIPIEKNRELLDLFAEKNGMTDKARNSLKTAFDRTKVVYAACFSDSSFRIAATGSFPSGARTVLFPKSSGWIPIRQKETGSWYHSELMDAAIPRNGLAFFAKGQGSIEDMFAALKTPDQVDTTGTFSAYACNATADGKIGFFIREAAPFISFMLGPDITLPILYAEIYAEQVTDQAYVVTADISVKDTRTARAMATILGLALDASIKTDNTHVYISGYSLKLEKLVEIIGNLYVI